MTICTQESPTFTANPLGSTPLAIDLDEVIAGRPDLPRLFCGHSPDGQRWLVAEVARSGEGRRWLWAPTSDRAVGRVIAHRARPADVLRHSVTGMVEEVTICPDGRICESVRLCAE